MTFNDAVAALNWYFDHGRGALQVSGIDYSAFTASDSAPWDGEAHVRLHGFRHRSTVGRVRRIEAAILASGDGHVLESVWLPCRNLPRHVALAFAWRDRCLVRLAERGLPELSWLVASGKVGSVYERCKFRVERAVDHFACAYV